MRHSYHTTKLNYVTCLKFKDNLILHLFICGILEQLCYCTEKCFHLYNEKYLSNFIKIPFKVIEIRYSQNLINTIPS